MGALTSSSRKSHRRDWSKDLADVLWGHVASMTDPTSFAMLTASSRHLRDRTWRPHELPMQLAWFRFPHPIANANIKVHPIVLDSVGGTAHVRAACSPPPDLRLLDDYDIVLNLSNQLSSPNYTESISFFVLGKQHVLTVFHERCGIALYDRSAKQISKELKYAALQFRAARMLDSSRFVCLLDNMEVVDDRFRCTLNVVVVNMLHIPMGAETIGQAAESTHTICMPEDYGSCEPALFTNPVTKHVWCAIRLHANKDSFRFYCLSLRLPNLVRNMLLTAPSSEHGLAQVVQPSPGHTWFRF